LGRKKNQIHQKEKRKRKEKTFCSFLLSSPLCFSTNVRKKGRILEWKKVANFFALCVWSKNIFSFVCEPTQQRFSVFQ